MRKVICREGDWFAVPLGHGDYAPGLAARLAAKTKGVLGYFFARRFSRLPSLRDVQDLRAAEAVRIRRFADLALRNGEWPLIGRVDDWNRTEWPVPPMARTMPGDSSYVRVERSWDDPDIVLRQTRGYLTGDPLDRAGAWAPETVEAILVRLLGTSRRMAYSHVDDTSHPRIAIPKPGDVFLVPLGADTYSVGLVGATSSEQNTVVAFFSARAVQRQPAVGAFRGLTRSSILRVFTCDDLNLRSGTWPIIGPLLGWDPVEWQTPLFVRRDQIAEFAHRSGLYSGERDVELRDLSLPYPVTRVESDNSANSRAVELEMTALLRSDCIVPSYREGTWVAVPLPGRPGIYVPGLIARVAADHKAFFGYFFAEAVEGIPTLDRLRSYRPEMAAEAFWFDDVALLFKAWPIINATPNWNRDEWPMPPQHRWKLDLETTEAKSSGNRIGVHATDISIEQVIFEQDGIRTTRMFTKREIVGSDYVGYGLGLTIADRTRRKKLAMRNMSRRRGARH